MKNQILVIGGTGTVGRPLVGLLAEAGANFTVLTRSEAKAKELTDKGVRTAVGELGQWSSVRPALKDVDTVFLLTSPSLNKVAQQNGLIDLAKEEGVRKIVKISAVIAERGSKVHLADWHGQIEDHLTASGLEYINLRPHSFMQNMLMHLGSIKSQGCFYESMGDAPVPMIDARDVAQASLDCLLSDHLNNETYVITGPSSISYGDMARALSEATNRNISYIQVPAEAHNEGMKAAGLPDWLADDLTTMSRMWGQVPVHPPTNDFGKISKTAQHDVIKFASDHAAYFM